MRLPPETHIVILTGAGISAESGISTFRDANGLWENHRIEEVASPEGFAKDPMMVHTFYNLRREQLLKVEPNPGHIAIACLQKHWPGEVLLVTQNVDDLHERAGSPQVLHMHGELRKIRCLACKTIRRWETAVTPETPCPGCGLHGFLRPHIVWFGEETFELDRIESALQRCGCFISVGTSGQVYPAAEFVEWANPFAYTLELNLEEGSNASSFFEHRRGPAGTLLPALIEELLSGLP